MDEQPVLATLGASLALGVVGCTNNNACDGEQFEAPPAPDPSVGAPPTVLEGEWIANGVLELSFSEPLSPTRAPDPRRFALLSWSARVSEYSYYYEYGVNSNDNNTCFQRTNYNWFGRAGYFYGYQPAIADVWIAPEDPSLLRLTNSGAQCPNNFGNLEGGLMLAYAGRESAEFQRLEDAAGDPVPSLGPSWALTSASNNWQDCILQSSGYCGYRLSTTYQGHLPLVDSLAPIPCP